MKASKCLLTLLCSVLLLPTVIFAQTEDPVLVEGFTAKMVEPSGLKKADGKWARIQILLLAKYNPEKDGPKDLVRNVKVSLSMIYEDQKNKGGDFLVFSKEAELLALKINKKTPVVFYVPWEVYELYRIRTEPFAWGITLSVAGAQIPLSKSNYKTMLSSKIARAEDPKKAYESFTAMVSKSAKANEGMLMTLPETPLSVQYYEYTNGSTYPIPTYMVNE